MNKTEEFNKKTQFLNIKGTEAEYIYAFAEAYHQSRVNAISGKDEMLPFYLIKEKLLKQ